MRRTTSVLSAALLSFGILFGCGDANVDPTVEALCAATCQRVAECFSDGELANCVEECADVVGPVSCDQNQTALGACVTDTATLACEALEAGELPRSCGFVCTGQRVCEDVFCDDGNDCTDDFCDRVDGACIHPTAIDGTLCRERGLCRRGRCASSFACTEQGIRDAIAFGDGPNTFTCNVPTTVTSGSEIVIDTDVILDGEGNLLVSGNDTHRVFSVAFGVTVELRRLTVTRGNAEDGAGILSNGTLTITDSVISNNSASREGGGVLASGREVIVKNTSVVSNSAARGGGISNWDTLTMNGAIVSGNEASEGGGVSNRGTLTANESIFSDNAALGFAGGIVNEGNLTISNSEISRNTAVYSAGGLSSNGGHASLNMVNSTVSQNTVGDGCGGGMSLGGTTTALNSTVSSNAALGDSGCGGGIYVSGTLTLVNATFAENSATDAGSAIFVNQGVVGPRDQVLNVRNTVISGDCAFGLTATVKSRGHNIESPGDTCDLNESTDLVEILPQYLMLGSLTDNGGATDTHALAAGSVAIDLIPEAMCVDAHGTPLTGDQRGVARPQGAACDVGAFEAN